MLQVLAWKSGHSRKGAASFFWASDPSLKGRGYLGVPSCGVSQGKADVLEQRERDLRV